METKYGMEYSFTTYTGSVTDHDGNVYPTIQIGAQNWMGENLKNTHQANGTAIPLTEEWPGSGGLSYCWYEMDISNKDIYGALYNWAEVFGLSFEVTDEYNICPAGWHVPSDAEWSQLSDYLGGPDLAGGKLKGTGTGTVYWNHPNTGATNESGFNALPGGLRSPFDGTFNNSGSTPWAGAFFWTSTRVKNDNTIAYGRHLVSIDSQLFRNESLVWSYYSIRCVQDHSQ